MMNMNRSTTMDPTADRVTARSRCATALEQCRTAPSVSHKEHCLRAVAPILPRLIIHHNVGGRTRGSEMLCNRACPDGLISSLVAACFLVLWTAPTALGTDVESQVGPTSLTEPGGLLEVVLFYGVAAVVVVSALGVCISKNIVRMAVWLFVALGSVAVLYFLMAATFIGAIQLLVYSGGTLVLLVFGVMLTSKSPWVRFEPARWELAGAGVACGGMFIVLCTVACRAVWPDAGAASSGTAIAAIGRALMSQYVVPFEMAGVVLMIVMVGAAHMARQQK